MPQTIIRSDERVNGNQQPCFFLALQATYTSVEVGLCHNQIIDTSTTIPTHDASKQLIPTVAALLAERHLALRDLAFCIVSVGPAPFTTLRTVIATVQGLAYGARLPMVAVNGLEAFAQSRRDASTQVMPYTHTFVLLHAFGQDVYYAQADHVHTTVTTGCLSFEAWLVTLTQFLKAHPTARIRFVGNGYAKHTQRLMETFDRPLCAYDAVPGYLPFTELVATGVAQWEAKQGIVRELTPLYFKSYV